MILVCAKCNGSFENCIICPQCGIPLPLPIHSPPAPSANPLKEKPDVSGFAGSDNVRWGDRPQHHEMGKPPQEARQAESSRLELPQQESRHAPASRVFAGLLLALGLSFGLLQLCVMALRLSAKNSESVALTPGLGLGLFYGMQALALVLAGVLISAGRKKGTAYGAIVGLVSGVTALVIVRSNLLPALVQPFTSDLFFVIAPDEHPPMVFQGVALHLITLYGLPLVYLLSGALGGFLGSRIWKSSEIHLGD